MLTTIDHRRLCFDLFEQLFAIVAEEGGERDGFGSGSAIRRLRRAVPVEDDATGHAGLTGVFGQRCAGAEIWVATQRVAAVRQLNQQRAQVGVHHGQVSRSGITKAVSNAIPVDAGQQPLAAGAFQAKVYQRPRRIGIIAVIGAQRGQKFRAEQVINEGLPRHSAGRFAINGNAHGGGERIKVHVHGVLHCSGKEEGEHHPGGEAFPTGVVRISAMRKPHLAVRRLKIRRSGMVALTPASQGDTPQGISVWLSEARMAANNATPQPQGLRPRR